MVTTDGVIAQIRVSALEAERETYRKALEVARVGLDQLPAESITDIEIKRVAIGKIDHVLSTPSRTYQCGLCGKWPYDIDPLPCSKSDCPHRR